jgi:hypothetical protein
MHRMPFSRAPLHLRRFGLYLAALLALLTLQPLAAQDATEEAPYRPMLIADIPADFVPEYNAGQLSLVRPDDLLTIYTAAGDAAASWYAEPPALDPEAAVDAYNPFDMYTFDPDLRTIETVNGRDIVTQTFFNPAYGENVLFAATLLDPETLLVTLAVKADADLDNADRTLVLDLIGNLEVDTAAEPPAQPEDLSTNEMREGEMQLTDGTIFSYDPTYAPFEGTLVASVVTLWTEDNRTYMTVYTSGNEQHIGERNAQEFNIEPIMQQAGLEDFEAATDGEVIVDEDGRTITRYITPEWSPDGISSQVNFFYLVVEDEAHMALFQGLTVDTANAETHDAAVRAMGESLVFGDGE